HLQGWLDRLRFIGHEPDRAYALLLEEPDQRLERRKVALAAPRHEAGRPEVAREAGLCGESLKEAEAVARETHAESGFVLLPHEGAAVPRRTGGHVALLHEDGPDASTRQVERQARPHAAAADDDDVGVMRERRGRHASGNGCGLYRAFLGFL